MSGKSSIVVTALSHLNLETVIIFDIESGFDLKTHQYWAAPKVRYLTKLRREYDNKRWWKRFTG